MNLTMIDAILTVAPDAVGRERLAPWTRSVAVAAAAARKKDEHPALSLVSTVSRIGWTIQSASDDSLELSAVRAAVTTPGSALLDSFLAVLGGNVPSGAATLLNEWWANAQTDGSVVATIALAEGSDTQTVMDLRTVTLPVAAGRWLGSSPLQGRITRTQLVLNPDVYGPVAADLEQKAHGLADRVRTVRVTGPGDAP